MKVRRISRLSRVVALVIGVMLAALPLGAAADVPIAQWPMSGQNLFNTRSQLAEFKISPANAAKLATKWAFTTGGDVSATPVVGGVVYFPDFAGNLYALNATTGAPVWSHQISDYNGVAGSYSRTSPAVNGNVLYLGDQTPNTLVWPTGQGAHMMAVNAQTGQAIWRTTVDTHPASIITSSPVVYNNIVYVGVSSNEEAVAAVIPGYQCCTFRGSLVALNATTGQILWKTYTVPDGYSGGAVWGSNPVVDPVRNSLYVGTGNNYNVPDSISSTCLSSTNVSCIASNDYVDSVLALDLGTGAVKWATLAQGLDFWNVACLFGSSVCPQPEGPDYDFGSAPNLITFVNNGPPRQILGVGQKSGIYWAFDPDNGKVLWRTQVGPGGVLGGIEWGSASDGKRIYVAEANASRLSYTLANGQTVNGGSWAALDPATGKILWQTADPASAMDTGPVTVANGVVYAGSTDPQGHVYALNAATGQILWSFATGGSVSGGASVVNGVVYWGSGYSKLAAQFGTTGNNKFYAFAAPGS